MLPNENRRHAPKVRKLSNGFWVDIYGYINGPCAANTAMPHGERGHWVQADNRKELFIKLKVQIKIMETKTRGEK